MGSPLTVAAARVGEMAGVGAGVVALAAVGAWPRAVKLATARPSRARPRGFPRIDPSPVPASLKRADTSRAARTSKAGYTQKRGTMQQATGRLFPGPSLPT